MTADLNTEPGSALELAAGPDAMERAADPAEFVVQACERAKAWLAEVLDHGGIEQIAELKSQAEAVRVYTMQKQLGKDAELAATEVVRRAERGIGVAIRKGQASGDIRRRGQGSKDSQLPADTGKLASPTEFASSDELSGNGAGIYHLTDGVPEDVFEDAVIRARAEQNLSRANVIRKIRERHAPPSGEPVPAPADQSPEAGERRGQLIATSAAEGLSSRQIARLLGVPEHRVRLIAREHRIDIPGDAAAARGRRHDSNRIVRETALSLEGLVLAVELADIADLDRSQVGIWTTSITSSLRVLRRFTREMKEAFA